jgi:hypothetical protein
MSMDSLPSLFGRYTANASEHRQLALTLRRLEDMCAAIDSAPAEPPVDLRPDRLIDELLDELKHHFQGEEAPAYFGAVAVERPSLVPRIAELRADHTAMLETVESLCGLADDHQRTQDFVAATRGLIVTLRAHEQRETSLMHEFFSRDGM